MALLTKRTSIPAVRARGDRHRLPLEIEVSAGKGNAVSSFAIGAMLAIFAYSLWSGFLDISFYGPAVAGILEMAPTLLLIASAGFAVSGLVKLSKKRLVKIDRTEVSVHEKGLLRDKCWTEPLGAYTGVRWREVKLVRSGNSSSRTIYYQIIDLQHPNPAKSIPIFVDRAKGDTRGVWEGYAKLLHLPALDERDGQVLVRNVEDLDKSIKELAQEGKVETDWDAGAAVPAGLAMTTGGSGNKQEIVVTLHRKRIPMLIFGIAMALGLFILVPAAMNFSVFGVAFSGALIAGCVWLWKFETNNPRTIRITRSQIEIRSPTEGTGTNAKIIAHADIENVAVKTSPNGKLFGGELVIATDIGELKTANGLSNDALMWLSKLILSAVAKA